MDVSPDINLIENLWVKIRRYKINNAHQLKEKLNVKWENIISDVIKG